MRDLCPVDYFLPLPLRQLDQLTVTRVFENIPTPNGRTEYVSYIVSLTQFVGYLFNWHNVIGACTI